MPQQVRDEVVARPLDPAESDELHRFLATVRMERVDSPRAFAAGMSRADNAAMTLAVRLEADLLLADDRIVRRLGCGRGHSTARDAWRVAAGAAAGTGGPDRGAPAGRRPRTLPWLPHRGRAVCRGDSRSRQGPLAGPARRWRRGARHPGGSPCTARQRGSSLWRRICSTSMGRRRAAAAGACHSHDPNQQPHQRLRDHPCPRRRELLGEPGRDPRAARPQRRRQDDHHADRHRLPHPRPPARSRCRTWTLPTIRSQ